MTIGTSHVQSTMAQLQDRHILVVISFKLTILEPDSEPTLWIHMTPLCMSLLQRYISYGVVQRKFQEQTYVQPHI